MRVVTVIGVLLAGGAATLTAQHAHQLEFGGFTSWIRYDRAFGLNNTFDSWKSLGFGGRIGYFLSDYVGLEVDANVATPTYKATGDTTTAVVGSASLIINSGTGGNVLYLLGGYARLHLGRSEEHTSELQSPCNLVCRLLLEKKKRIVGLYTSSTMAFAVIFPTQ